MITGEHLLCLSSIDWDSVWQGHQEIMSTFAKHGNDVLFIENTGVRMPTPRDWPRLQRRLVNWFKSFKGFRKVQDRLWVYSPIILPGPYSRVIRWINQWLLLTAIRRWIRATGSHDPIIWTFLPTGIAVDILTHLEHKLAVYYCIAEFEELVPHPHKVRRTEQAVIQHCDLIFAQGPALEAKCRQWNPQVHVFPFGVNLEAFEQAHAAPRLPDDLHTIPRPIIGYVGGVHRHVDFHLLQFIATQRKEWSLALIGPVQADISPVNGSSNIFFLGQKPFEELPHYIQAFEVAMIPYVESEYTKTVYPTKLNEYHALGKPVVSTFLPEVAAFNERYGPLVQIAKDYPQFVQHVEQALSRRDDHLVQRRIAAAYDNGWDRRIEEMSRLMADRIRQQAATGPVEWQERLVMLYHRARRRIARIGLALLAAYLLIFYTPVVWWAASPLQISQAPVPSDAIVVFAGGVGESGKPAQGYEERVAWAAELYHQGFAQHLIFSSGYMYTFREPDVMKVLAVSLGVPAERIILEDQATNTFDNVRFVNRILGQQGWTQVLVVSSPYHMRRVQLVWNAQAPDKRAIYVPIPISRFYSHQRGPDERWIRKRVTLQQANGILHEYLGILSYWKRGYLSKPLTHPHATAD